MVVRLVHAVPEMGHELSKHSGIAELGCQVQHVLAAHVAVSQVRLDALLSHQVYRDIGVVSQHSVYNQAAFGQGPIQQLVPKT